MIIIVDMNLSPEWEKVFPNEYEIKHWSSIGNFNAPDTEIFQYAKEVSAVVLTNDTDFGAILASSHFNTPSVFLIRSLVLDPQIIGTQVFDCFEVYKKDLKNGCLISFDLNRARIRKLPLT